MGVDRSAYLDAFREEMVEHLQALTEGLLTLESHPEDVSSVGEVFRRVHTIKGSARMMGFGGVADLAHAMEDVLDDLRSGRLRPSPPLLDAILTTVDLLRELVKAPPEEGAERSDVQAILRWLGDLRGVREEAAAGAAPQDQPAARVGERAEGPTRETVRVDVGRIDRILNLAGELMVLDAARKQWLDEMSQLVEMLDTAKLVAQGAGLRGLGEQAQALSQTASRTAKRYRRLVTQQTELVRELHYQVSALRMLPARAILSALPRAARDLAREEQREVEILIEGDDTEIDREVLERVRDPILHLVRNSIVHGIEPPAARSSAGKPRVGKIRIAAYSRGEQAIIEVQDDGVGVDFDAVRQAAVERGILTLESSESLDDAECIRLLFLPGFTTTAAVSESSGRGVGLDVVKSEVDALKGRVSLDTRPGEGTRVTLEMPITLAFTHVLLLEIGRSIYAIPCSSTHGIAEVPAGAVRSLQTREAVDMSGRTVPLVWTHRILGVESRTPGGATRWPALLLGPVDRPIAFVVDRVIGDENVIAKPLGPFLRGAANVSGGVILGDGRVALVLSAASLVDAARGVLSPQAVPASPRLANKGRKVLVVDDAAISRELQRSILTAAGYRVEIAVDGLDALQKLKAREFDLVVADVEMPRMTGLELVSAVRADPELASLPIVIVSARESDEDRRLGMQMGAQAYVGKGSFDQATLLDTIESLIG